MANTKISALTSATTPLDGTEVLPIVQSSTTKKVANNDLRPKQIQSNATSGVLQIAGPAASTTRVMTTPDANFTAARTDAAQSFTGDQTLSTGNIIQGTAAKGFNFTANTGAAGKTSQLLSWYEEGTWTPVIADAATGGNTATATVSGNYTRVGNAVTVTFKASSITTTGMTAGNNVYIRGLPFTNKSNQYCYGTCDVRNVTFTTQPFMFINDSVSYILLFQNSSGGGVTATLVSNLTSGSASIFGSITYLV